MANKGITQLQVAGPLAGTEPLPIVQNGITKQTTVLEVAQFAQQDVVNDTTTTTPVYPLFSYVTSGNLGPNIYTSDANYLYTPSLGLLQARVVQADNGIVVNNATVTDSFTLLTGNNGVSGGPMTVASGATVTVSSGSVWTVTGVYSLAPWSFDTTTSPSKLIIKRFGSSLVSVGASGDITAFGTVNANGTP